LNITCQLIPPALKVVTNEKLESREGGKCWVMVSDHGDGCSLNFLISRLGNNTFPFLLPPAILIVKCSNECAANMAAPFKMLLLLQHQYIGGTLPVPVQPIGK
jgi:hypothetical protein